MRVAISIMVFIIFYQKELFVISTFLGVAISRGHYCRWEALAPPSPFRPEYIGIFQICTHISFLFWNLHFVSLKFSFHLSKFVSVFLAIICWYILSNSSIYNLPKRICHCVFLLHRPNMIMAQSKYLKVFTHLKMKVRMWTWKKKREWMKCQL